MSASLPQRIALLGNPNSISLEKLMSDSRLKGTVIEGRSYGKVIDDILV